MQLNTLEEWLEVQGRLINCFNKKYGFKRLELTDNRKILLQFDGIECTIEYDEFIDMEIEDIPQFVTDLENSIKRFWD